MFDQRTIFEYNIIILIIIFLEVTIHNLKLSKLKKNSGSHRVNNLLIIELQQYEKQKLNAKSQNNQKKTQFQSQFN